MGRRAARRGADELSADQGTYGGDSLDRERATKGDDAANRLQLRWLDTDQLDDALAGLVFLRSLPGVDPHPVAAVGHSFGGMLTLLLAERRLRCARLLTAVGRTKVPTFLIHAANDYSVAPGQALAAEMQRLGKPHRMKIYPAFGHTLDEGHGFVYLAVSTWEPDVFAFLDQRMRR